MKKIFFAFILSLFCLSGFAQEVTFDKENCTITKDGKTFPMYGTVRVVDSGTADLTVKVVEYGSSDVEVKVIEEGATTCCGEWKLVTTGTYDFSVRFYETGPVDINVKFIEYGSGGINH